MSAIVSEHPEVKAVLCANDSMALGAVSALKAAGRAGSVLVGGFDNISAVQQLVRDGQIVATADQHGDRLAAYGIEYALQMLRDRTARPGGPRDARRPDHRGDAALSEITFWPSAALGPQARPYGR